MSDNSEIEIRNLGRVKYLDLGHRYFLEGYEGFWFDERLFLLMEKYFFNFIDQECNLIITMYEEEFVEPETLPKVLEIIDRQMKNCDNDEVLELAKQLRDVVSKAIEVKSPVGFCF